jgi:predicted MPP superfamily phosphohydrolase
MLGGTLLSSYAYSFRRHDIAITRESFVGSPFKKNLKIVSISDLHAPGFPGDNGELIDLINSESPDIVVLAGDIIDKANKETLVRDFGSIKSSLLKIAALGNWEYLSDLDLTKLDQAYAEAGFKLLINEHMKIGPLSIIGLDDLIEGSIQLDMIEETLKTSGMVLLVSHCPEPFAYIRYKSDTPLLMISGHTHGGQIAPFGVPLVTPKGSGSYVQGWYHRNKFSLYVMRGIGMTPGCPIRLGSTPEIFVLNLIN